MENKKEQTFADTFRQELGIVDNITHQLEEYPKGFYLIEEALDLVLRVHVGEKMGTDGVDELATLFSILSLDAHLLYSMPKRARAFFKSIVNPQHQWDICQDAGLRFGSIYGAYCSLKTYLIDNKERVTEVYNKYYEVQRAITEENNKQYGKLLQDKGKINEK